MIDRTLGALVASEMAFLAKVQAMICYDFAIEINRFR